MTDISDRDCERLFKHLPEQASNDIEYEAYSATIDDWKDTREDDLDKLDAANDNPNSQFSWDITLEFERRDDHDELVPLAGVEPTDEREVYDLAHDFGWDYVRAVREEIRELVENSDFTAKELLALTIWSDDRYTNRDGATIMGYSSGSVFSGKASRARSKVETAETTIAVADTATHE